MNRALHTRPRSKPASRFAIHLPDDERRDLDQVVVERMKVRRLRGLSKLTKQPSGAKLVRLALQKMFASMTTEQLAELLETTEL
jgi:hypothetical protein